MKKKSVLQSSILSCLSLIVAMIICTGMKISITVPDPPGIPWIERVDASSCTITYSAPQNDGGSSITGYLIEMREEWWSVWERKGVTSELRFRVVGLEEGDRVKFRVRAGNAAGLSEPSEPSDFITIRNY